MYTVGSRRQKSQACEAHCNKWLGCWYQIYDMQNTTSQQPGWTGILLSGRYGTCDNGRRDSAWWIAQEGGAWSGLCATQLDGLVVVDVNGKIATRDMHMFCANPKWSGNLHVWCDAGVMTEGNDSKELLWCLMSTVNMKVTASKCGTHGLHGGHSDTRHYLV